jgi:predicted DNA binding CopG/RHH family protein
MQEPAAAVPTPNAASFASLLAALAAPAPKPAPEWNGDGLADDIATLSYEQALRTHARYRSADPADLPYRQDTTGSQSPHRRAVSAPAATPGPSATQNPTAAAEPKARRRPAALEENRKSASITIRLSKDEGVQLRERAAEAGLTVSAYLRSCIFEAEALRTQVREALAQFRSAAVTDTATDQKTPSKPVASAAPAWRTRLFPRWSASHGAARA